VTGYWFANDMNDAGDGEPRETGPDAPSGWRPPADLLAFLAAGPPPVYVGFGSMVGRDPRATTRTVLAAVQRAGTRAILASGWGGVSGAPRPPLAADLADALAPDRVFVLDEAPHAWLFPRVAAVVHHGGAGTTAAGLRAGCPTVVCPFFGDQPFWGARVAALGAGPPPIPQSRLEPRRLAAAIGTAATDRAMRRRAAALGAQIRGEHGVARAAAIVRDAITTGPRR
jgi:sterol 3beta-glucosyltransferase